MIPSQWKSRRDQEVLAFPKGGIDTLLADLLDLAAGFHIESTRWPDFRACDIYMTAWQIQTVAIHYARGKTSRDDAELWLAAGHAHLDTLIADRIMP